MFRPDGSIDSSNNPVAGNQYSVRDFGLYKGQVINVVYTDSEENTSGEDSSPRVQYEVRVMGGPRDGQIFKEVTELQTFGGISNYSERIWKGTTTLTRQDPASIFVLESYEELNGDLVYIQFVNGDLNYPVIIGGARHGVTNFEGATEEDGPRFTTKVNGITTEISKDGEFSWTKANGMFSPTPFPNPKGSPTLLQDQFVELPGFEEAVQITLGNEFDFLFKMNVTPGQGIEVAIDGTADTFTLTTLVGSSLLIDGTGDKLAFTTAAGLSVTADGLGDKFEVAGVAGATFALDGVSDAFTIATAAGSKLEVSGTSGISMEDPLGDKLSLSQGAVALENAAGAKLEFDAAGLIKLGNSSGDLLQIIGEAFTALSTQTAAGFGAPTSTVATFTQLLVKIKLLSG